MCPYRIAKTIKKVFLDGEKGTSLCRLKTQRSDESKKLFGWLWRNPSNIGRRVVGGESFILHIIQPAACYPHTWVKIYWDHHNPNSLQITSKDKDSERSIRRASFFFEHKLVFAKHSEMN